MFSSSVFNDAEARNLRFRNASIGASFELRVAWGSIAAFPHGFSLYSERG
jgi:hypothetical protein